MRGILRYLIAMGAVLLLVTPTTSRAEPGDVLMTLNRPPGSGGWGGELLDVDGNFIVSGAGIDVFNGITGEHRYRHGNPLGWPPMVPITDDDPLAEFDDYGGSVAKSDDGRFLVGAPNQSSVLPYGGSAFLYDAESGDLLQTFLDPSMSPNNHFGQSVAFVDGMVAIAAPYDNRMVQTNMGSVHFFDPETGGLVRTLENPREDVRGSFGYSIAGFGNLLLVGDEEGIAYLFDVPSEELLHTFTPSEGYPLGLFGHSVALTDGVAVVGAPFFYNPGSEYQTGAIYAFDTDSADLLGILEEPTPGGHNRFGQMMAVEGDSLLVGVHKADWDGKDTGAAYLYDLSSLELQQVFSNPLNNGNRFGRGIGFLGSNVAITSLPRAGGYTNPKAVYVFETVPEPGTVVLLLSAVVAMVLCRQLRTGCRKSV